MNFKNHIMLFTTLFICCLCSGVVLATINITSTQFLRDPETLVSINGNFKMGFFSPVNSTSRYVGIWYNVEDSDESEVVWVANRDNPIKDSSGVLKISEDGNLQLSDGQNATYWSSNVSNLDKGSVSVAQVLDTGNLVLFSGSRRTVVWQSFDQLTNALLPMRLVIDQQMEEKAVLRSWKNTSDPSSGRFTLILIAGALPEFVTQYDDKPYWRSGPWNGYHFLGVPSVSAGAGNGFRFMNNDNEGTFDFLFSVANQSILAHYVLNYDGNVFQKNWDGANRKWNVSWQSLGSECEFYGKCGSFGTCNPNHSPICSCLKGFKPKSYDEWSNGNWTSGCVRRTPLQCSETGGKLDGFLRLENVKVPDYARWLFTNDEDDCRRKCLYNCSCLAYAYPRGIGCMVWNGSLIDIQVFSGDSADLFIRLADSELGKSSKSKIITAVIAITATATFVVVMYYLWKWIHRRYGKKATNREAMSMETDLVDNRMSQAMFKDLVLFKFKNLEDATNNFLPINKLGQGGFGPVYKGKLEDGQEIAVKRLSRASGQGVQEFMNEVQVISKLQHKNLVRLLGCCVEREEKILVYEYMPNKSLDALLFDPQHQKELDWKKRFKIINGVCRGLLYLHRDSRLKIIHRDLKASNVLLDEDLNPKISDFGMARIFGTEQDQANTLRIVGTYGYMSPEYAMEGRFSDKSDVFSFGVLLLEIISGRKNSSFTDHDSLSLLRYAWKLWNENEMLSLIDSTIIEPYLQDQILKCIKLGLLCVQEFPEDRPTISEVISMLDFDNITDLPHPKPPGFTQRQVCSSSTDGFIQNGIKNCTVNHISLTVVSGR